MTLQLIEEEGSTHPVRFQALCTRCGYHWPMSGYVLRGSACLAFERHLHACEPLDPDGRDAQATAEAFHDWRSQQ